MNIREDIISKIYDILSLPPILSRVYQLVSSPDVDFHKLSEIIKYDPGLTANILKLANSAYFGFARKIGSVHQAIVRLGTKRIYDLTMTSLISPIIRKPVEGYNLPAGKLWEHSIAVAICSEQLAKELEIKPPDYLFTTGLLHDVGKIILGVFIEVDALPIKNLVFQQGVPFNVAERRVLGIDHAEVGSILFDNWRFPDYIVKVTKYHHQPERCNDEMLALDLVHVADHLSLISGIGGGDDGLNYRMSSEVFSRLKLNYRRIEDVMCESLEKIQEIINIFNSNGVE